MDERLEEFLDRCLLLDLETGPDGAVRKIGAVWRNEAFLRQGRFESKAPLAELDDVAADAHFLLGHNLLGHDLPCLQALAPGLRLLRLPVVDTLYLSPLAFPENPYHRLVKDYKLVHDSLSEPVADARLAARVLREQWEELKRRGEAGAMDLLRLYRFCFQGACDLEHGSHGVSDAPTGGCGAGALSMPVEAPSRTPYPPSGDSRRAQLRRRLRQDVAEPLRVPPYRPSGGGSGLAAAFASLGAELPDEGTALVLLRGLWSERACASVTGSLAEKHLTDPVLRPIAAYATAWLQVAGANSVLPPWVRHRFPATVKLLHALRDIPCGDPACTWCREIHDPRTQLKRWLGFEAFRSQPAGPDGRSLQEAVVSSAMGDQSLLAILPTGGGKSLCFQLPALVRNQRRGVLTVVISPLQALMKDQVDNLVKKTGTTGAAAIFGLLTPPERGDVMERVRLGDIAILYISPEQLRNRSVAEVLASREIGCWVFDEAHCLSKWGHDFRPDYLYAGRFIRTLAERQRTAIPPVACFTATAKREVTAEILAYFRDELGLELSLFEGGVERSNLDFEVQITGKHEKDARIHAILTEHLGAPRPEPEPGSGGAIVYAARRRRTEELAERLLREGWSVAAFHAGIGAPEKKRIQEAFIAGELQVICATNAFGMGVDKQDVRIVLHADIPGSLENYIQEAGRAGRDRKPARCVLLYDEQDIEAQFGMEALSELSRRDIAEILRALRRFKRDQDGFVVATSGELLRDEELRLGFDAEARDADTRVRIAIAWLERAGLVRRDENRTGVFQGRPAVPDLTQARRKIQGLNLSAAQQARWLAIMEVMLDADPDEGISADDLARLPAFAELPGAEVPAWDRGETPAQRVMRTLHDMAGAGLLQNGPQLTAFVRHKVKDHSLQILERIARLERAMIETLREQAPDAETGEWLPLSLRRLNQHLLDQDHESSNPETLRALLKGLSLDGRGLAGSRGSLDLRQSGRDHYRVRLHRDWRALSATAERRQAVADLVLRALLAKLPADAPASTELLVSFGTDELTRALQGDMTLAAEVRDPLAAMERALVFLHDQGAIILHGGFAVFRSAMTIQLLPEAKGRRYTQAQYQPLAQHYGERTFQIHVMDEYARLGAEKIRQALGLVTAYFTLGKEAFVRRFFAERREMLSRATTAESFRRIVDALGNPAQTEIVAAPEEGNRLVLAGPGSGKTRVIVHRCAYLLRVLRVPAHRILVLCFNRSAALELRRRLAGLVGDDARGVTVQTYHGFAMRLTGRSYAERLFSQGDAGPDFEGLIAEAVDLLEGRIELPGIEPDTVRERLLAGYRHILVDEYQDIDADQYRLVAAIAGRTRSEDKLTLLAVGDDDQNIYAFRGASVEYIRRFREDYEAEIHYLVENYRSSGHIIAAANALVAHNRERMKRDHPIRIDRRRASQHLGGRWERLDALTKGRVLVLRVADPAAQAAALVRRIQEQHRLGGGDWSDFAVLARRRDLLWPFRALCEHQGIPVSLPGDLPALHRVREIDTFLAALKQREREPLTAAALTDLSPQNTSPWRTLLQRLIEDWAAEAGNAAVPATEIAEFCWETLAEQRREGSIGDGVLLTTLHGTKGLEFDHVLIVDGGWNRDANCEAERRTFYVGMTRGRETLTLLEIAGGRHPHLPFLQGDCLLRAEPSIEAPPPEIMFRRYCRLTPADLDLSYAGRQSPNAPIHRCLAALGYGDHLGWRDVGESLLLLDRADNPVTRLSKRAVGEWLPRLDQMKEIRVVAMLRRNREDGDPKYRNILQSETWEVPLVEVVWYED